MNNCYTQLSEHNMLSIFNPDFSLISNPHFCPNLKFFLCLASLTFSPQTVPLVAQLLKSLASSFPGQVEAAAAALPAEQQAAVAEVMAS